VLTVTLHTLRTRWATLVGSFVALSLGVALLTVTGLALASSLDAPDRAPERFAAAPVVVRGQDALRVPTPVGDRTERLARPRAVPAGTVAELRRLGRVVEDRSFAVRAERGPGDLVGHPWSTAAFAPYGIDAGRAPRAAGEVVVTGDWAAPGERLRTDRGVVEVVGTVPDRGFENAVFYTDAEAARLSPVSLQLVVDADASAVRDAVRGSAGVRVLTGDERRYADADPERDSEAMTAMNALFGTAGGVSAFVSVFVVASTFAFAVRSGGGSSGCCAPPGRRPDRSAGRFWPRGWRWGRSPRRPAARSVRTVPRSWPRGSSTRAWHRRGSASATTPGRTTRPSGRGCSSPCAARSRRPGGPAGPVPRRHCARCPWTPGP
jgi:putative ABC transport system permease protein